MSDCSRLCELVVRYVVDCVDNRRAPWGTCSTRPARNRRRHRRETWWRTVCLTLSCRFMTVSLRLDVSFDERRCAMLRSVSSGCSAAVFTAAGILYNTRCTGERWRDLICRVPPSSSPFLVKQSSSLALQDRSRLWALHYTKSKI